MTNETHVPADLRLVALTGGIASGKSTVAKMLAETLGLELIRGRMLIERELQSRGMPITEQNMQDVGHELISTMGGYEFTLRVLQLRRTTRIVYDSFRNVSEVVGLRRAIGKRLIVVYLDIDIGERRRRFTQRYGRENTIETFDVRSKHSVEGEVEKIRSLADVAVQSAPIGEQVDQIAMVVRDTWGKG